jgi:ethanolamine utilization protein EutN
VKLGRVIGTLVASVKYQGLEGVKFLIIQPLDKNLESAGQPKVAADGTAMAGPGELIYYEESREAALACPVKFVPVDTAIVGLVDELSVQGRKVWSKGGGSD